MADRIPQVGEALHVRSPMLDVSVRTEGDALVVELSGELDVYSVYGLRQDLAGLGFAEPAVPAGHRRLLVLDLTSLIFCDSSGLGLIVGTGKRARAAGGGLVLIGVPEHLAKVLRITGLTKVLPTAGSTGEACDILDELAAAR